MSRYDFIDSMSYYMHQWLGVLAVHICSFFPWCHRDKHWNPNGYQNRWRFFWMPISIQIVLLYSGIFFGCYMCFRVSRGYVGRFAVTISRPLFFSIRQPTSSTISCSINLSILQKLHHHHHKSHQISQPSANILVCNQKFHQENQSPSREIITDYGLPNYPPWGLD